MRETHDWFRKPGSFDITLEKIGPTDTLLIRGGGQPVRWDMRLFRLQRLMDAGYTLNGFDPIKFIPNGVCLTGFHSNWPSEEVMREIFSFLEGKGLEPCIGAVYDFKDIREASMALDNGKVNGKIVVKV